MDFLFLCFLKAERTSIKKLHFKIFANYEKLFLLLKNFKLFVLHMWCDYEHADCGQDVPESVR